MNIKLYKEERRGYVLEEMGFVVGKWESKHHATFDSIHYSDEWEYFCQLHLIHPFHFLAIQNITERRGTLEQQDEVFWTSREMEELILMELWKWP